MSRGMQLKPAAWTSSLPGFLPAAQQRYTARTANSSRHAPIMKNRLSR